MKKELNNKAKEATKKVVNKLFEEKVMVTMPKPFVQKTEKLSSQTKSEHEGLYRRYIEDFNKVQMQLQTASRTSDYLSLRSLYNNRTFLLNAIKLHELYFANISDLSSELSVNTLTYTKLSESFGTFEMWQQDFISACMVSREGWGILYYDPYLKNFTNCVVDLHNDNIPIGCIPILVMDMWSHAYYIDYGTDKKSYVYNMMKEINWTIVEARMESALGGNVANIFSMRPMINPDENNLVNIPTSVNFQEMPIVPGGLKQSELASVQKNQPTGPETIVQEKANKLIGDMVKIFNS